MTFHITYKEDRLYDINTILKGGGENPDIQRNLAAFKARRAEEIEIEHEIHTSGSFSSNNKNSKLAGTIHQSCFRIIAGGSNHPCQECYNEVIELLRKLQENDESKENKQSEKHVLKMKAAELLAKKAVEQDTSVLKIVAREVSSFISMAISDCFCPSKNPMKLKTK